MADWDVALWWIMVATGGGAALLSLGVSWLDRGGGKRLGQRKRYFFLMISYALMSVSILVFALRGFLVTP